MTDTRRVRHPIDLPPGPLHVTRALREAGWETYAVGGAVRDALRGLSPVDVDLATAAPPEAVTPPA